MTAPTFRLLEGDVLDQLATLPDESVHCVVTSPPYWGLRDYGVDGQLGLEATAELYVERMVAVFREVRRVLRTDGTCWLNIGDSYASGGLGGASPSSTLTGGGGRYHDGSKLEEMHNLTRPRLASGLKPKDLVGVPWRLAFALQADGWWLRSEIIWAKPNPMPESVTDRPTKAHEQVFLLTKSARYFYDADAVREPYNYDGRKATAIAPHEAAAHENYKGRHGRERWPGIGKAQAQAQAQAQARRDATEGGHDESEPMDVNPGGRNLRSVWTIPTEPYPDAHFATYPTRLVETCVKAGTSEHGCCPECGAPWERRVIATGPDGRTGEVKGRKAYDAEGRPLMGDNMIDHGTRGSFNSGGATLTRTTAGWLPTCICDGIDRRQVAPPAGEGERTDDPSREVGRAGMSRPRRAGEGTRPITRHEQAEYARQLRESPHVATMSAEAGPAFAHYTRTDDSGARPIPQHLLDAWIGRGWLAPVPVPPPAADPIPCTVLDPFLGSGTTAHVALALGRSAIGIELNPDYAALARKRVAAWGPKRMRLAQTTLEGAA